MPLKSFVKKAISPVASALSKANDIRLDDGYELPANITLKGVQLSGKVSLSEGCLIRSGVKISAQSLIEIGRYTSINGPATEINADINKIMIGSFCSIARQTTIQESNHRDKSLTTYNIFKNIFNEDVKKDVSSKGDMVIGNDVWIGANSTIVSGVKIGHGAIVAANSAVTKDVPNYAVVGGVPAKVIKMRFKPDVIKKLLEIEWWDWELKKIRKNRDLFEKAVTVDALNEF